jgi:hypothetical protein
MRSVVAVVIINIIIIIILEVLKKRIRIKGSLARHN